MTKNEIVNYFTGRPTTFPRPASGKVEGQPITSVKAGPPQCGGPAYHVPNWKYDHSPSCVPGVTSTEHSEPLVAVKERHPWPPILFLHTLHEQITHSSDYVPNLRGRFLVTAVVKAAAAPLI